MNVINADDCNLSFSLSSVDLVTYITRFQWDMAKYPIKQSLKNISEIISKVCWQIWSAVDMMFDILRFCVCVYIYFLIGQYYWH